MPNQDNFRSDIIKETKLTFFPSRIVNNREENIYIEEIPASFAYSESDVIEVHFYTLSTNTLMLSTTISVNDFNVLKSHIVTDNLGQPVGTYVRVDFTQLFALKNLILIPGEYKVVFNLFSNEIGNYDNRDLFIQDISPSKLEVQIGFVNNPTVSTDPVFVQNENNINNFVYKYFTKDIAIAVAKKILTPGTGTDASDEIVNYTNIVENINVTNPYSDSDIIRPQTLENTIDRVRRLGIEADTSAEINTFIQSLLSPIEQKIITDPDGKITESEFIKFIEDAVNDNLSNLSSKLDNKITIS